MRQPVRQSWRPFCKGKKKKSSITSFQPENTVLSLPDQVMIHDGHRPARRFAGGKGQGAPCTTPPASLLNKRDEITDSAVPHQVAAPRSRSATFGGTDVALKSGVQDGFVRICPTTDHRERTQQNKTLKAEHEKVASPLLADNDKMAEHENATPAECVDRPARSTPL